VLNAPDFSATATLKLINLPRTENHDLSIWDERLRWKIAPPRPPATLQRVNAFMAIHFIE